MVREATEPGVKELVSRVKKYLPKEKTAQVEEAYRFAASCHDGQTRESGGPYIEHPLNTALLLADLHLDATTLSAALLHDVVEDCGVTCDELTKRFGPDVSKLVDGVTKLSQSSDKEYNKAASFRKILQATLQDPRVIIIKLADRYHNMTTLDALRPDKRARIAQETFLYPNLSRSFSITFKVLPLSW